MAKASMRRHLPHSPSDMMELVTNVERYPEFISLISNLRLITPRTRTSNGYYFEAEMMIRYKMIAEAFRCRVEVDERNHTVQVSKADRSGAIKSLKNHWTFRELSDGSTLLDFHIDVSLKSMPLNFLVNQKFESASVKVMDWFIGHAAENYPRVGKGNSAVASEIAALGKQRSV